MACPTTGTSPIVFPDYNGVQACTWKLGTKEPSPHPSIPLEKRKPILESVCEFIGGTPMIRLSRLAKKHGIECDLVAKCEFFSAGGSVKDRIALRMILEAEKGGKLKPGHTLIEGTSGNTGIGLSLVTAVKGYNMIITMPEKMSREKADTMRALGAEIRRTPTSAAWNSPESHIGLALKLQKEIPNSHILDQYQNVANPMAHYEWTGAEIVEQTGGKIDAVVISAGTGGTLTGISRKVKEEVPACKIIAVDPKGSILAEPDSLNDDKRLQSYLVEGIGYDFIPTVLERRLVDKWYKTDDEEAFLAAREVIRTEGLLVGGSSGSALAAALKHAKTMKSGERCVVILPDGLRNYMSKFLNNEWMIDKGFLSVPLDPTSFWAHGLRSSATIAELPPRDDSTAPPTTTIAELLQSTISDGVLVVDGGMVVGVVVKHGPEGSLLASLAAGKVKPADPVSAVMSTEVKVVTKETPLYVAAKFLEIHPVIAVVNNSSDKRLVRVVGQSDILSYMATAA